MAIMGLIASNPLLKMEFYVYIIYIKKLIKVKILVQTEFFVSFFAQAQMRNLGDKTGWREI